MKPLLVNTYDNRGGAAHAAYRVFEGLRDIGLDPHFLTRYRTKTDANVHASEPRAIGWVKGLLDLQLTKFYPKRQPDNFNSSFTPDRLVSWVRRIDPDLVNLHWVGEGFVNIKTLSKINRPIVWTLHDSWPFTGGCYVPYDCLGYEEACGNCPQLQSGRDGDLSRLVWRRKAKAWRDMDLTIVAPSSWMASTAKSSSLFCNQQVVVIPNGLDVKAFAPLGKEIARESLGLPAQSSLILFSSMGGVRNWNKGGDLLKESLAGLAKTEQNITVLLCGNNQPTPKDFFPVPHIDMGLVDDHDIMRRIYSAADLTVVPSRSESLGYVAMESMSCGTPCVSFSVGGLKDLIDHQVNGFLAAPYSTKSFAEGISWLLSDKEKRHKFSVNAREKIVAHFCRLKVAKRYQALYARLLEESLL